MKSWLVVISLTALLGCPGALFAQGEMRRVGPGIKHSSGTSWDLPSLPPPRTPLGNQQLDRHASRIDQPGRPK